MNYELAKQLKDAGFPQERQGGSTVGIKITDSIYIPTLSELIEACGEDLWTMKKGIFKGVDGWIVGKDSLNEENFPETNPYKWYIFSFGITLEEAIAKLWLKLNKK